MIPMSPVWIQIWVWITLTSLFRICRLYRDQQKRSLLTGHNALLLRHIVKDLLHALSHRHDNIGRNRHGEWKQLPTAAFDMGGYMYLSQTLSYLSSVTLSITLCLFSHAVFMIIEPSRVSSSVKSQMPT